MEKELFALLRLGLGTTRAEDETLSDFIMMPASQWAKIGELAQEQGVLGVVLDGVDRLDATSYGATRELSKELKLEWIGNVLNGYEARNQHQLAVIEDLQNKWSEAGLRTMVMKGQAMGTYYPNPMHRCPGDIDCYLFEDYAKGNKVAKKWADKVDEGWYKHSVISYKSETIENHQYFVHTREGGKSKQLNDLLVDSLKNVLFDKLPGTGVLLPPPVFNAVFLTYHALAHFTGEGLRLKQILDWAMFLKRDATFVDWNDFYKICDKYHFRRFVEVMNDIAVNYLGVVMPNQAVITNSPYTLKVIQSTLCDKDYVYGSGKSDWSNRFHLVRNLWTYRWKYRDIYEMSPLRQLWYYVTGFIFKTE